MVLGPWSRCIARASVLAERHPPAADILRFYLQLAAYQQKLAAEWTNAAWDPPLVLQALPATLDWIEQRGPAGLAAVVPWLRKTQLHEWRLALDRCLAEDIVNSEDVPRAFVIEALQPLAELCAAAGPAHRAGHDNRCPFCQQRPATGVLRDAGQGTRR